MKKVLIVLGIVAAVVVLGCVGTSVLVSALGKARESARAKATVLAPSVEVAAEKPKAPVVTVDVATIDKSEETQGKREAYIKTLSASGFFGDSRSNGQAGRVVVKPAFYALDFKKKEEYLSVVYAYYWDGKDDGFFMRLLYSKTNKEVGQYGKSLGGLKME